MHPIERLRYIARTTGVDQRALVAETAAALRALRNDPAGLVVSCRRIVERHPTSGPLWWMSAHLLTSADPASTAHELAGHIELDPTPDLLVDGLPDGATVCLLGWPDLAGEAVLRRGDLTVLAVDALDQGSSFVRRLQRNDVDAEVVEPSGLAAAVTAADVVLVEALAAGPRHLLAIRGSLAAASVAYCAEVPVWAVVGRGRRLPERAFDQIADDTAAATRRPWYAEAEVVPLALASTISDEHGPRPLGDEPLVAECPLAHELLRGAGGRPQG